MINLQCENGIHGLGSPKLSQELWTGPWRDPGLLPVELVNAAGLRAPLMGSEVDGLFSARNLAELPISQDQAPALGVHPPAAGP